MEWYESEVRALEHARPQGALPERPTVFYGSSSIRGRERFGNRVGLRVDLAVATSGWAGVGLKIGTNLTLGQLTRELLEQAS